MINIVLPKRNDIVTISSAMGLYGRQAGVGTLSVLLGLYASMIDAALHLFKNA